MNKIEFIRSKFREILSETIDERVKNIEKNLYDEAPFQGTGEFDYVQEGKGMCESCGGEMREGECSECGYRNEAEIMELGGMEDGHPRFGNKNLNKMTRKEKEDLMSDRSYEMRSKKFDDDFDNKMQELCPHCNGTGYDEFDDVECQWCDGTGEYDEYGVLKISDDMPSYKTKYRYNDDEEITEKLHGKQHRLDKNKNGRLDREDFKMLRKQQDEEEQLYEVEFNKEVEEGETDESREFAYAAMMAKKKGKDTFELDGETFDVKESILYTESDLLDLIESLVLEEKRKFKVTEPKGYREYERAHKADKKENDDYLKSVAKKMTDYLKKSSDSGSKYEMKKTKKFPTENGGLKKGIRKKYTPSDAVDDYIDAFSYPGQTNLVFDEIKPTEKNIEKYLKGHRTTGNAQVDDDGNALGNVVPSETGEKFFKNFKDNLYGQEQMDASYKRQPQPVDQAGEETERGSLKTKRGKKTSQSVLNKLEESIGEKSEKKLNEEFGRMHELMGYNRKTQ